MQFEHIKVPSTGQKIKVNQDLTLEIPNNPIIPFIEGDGIGVDITPVMKKVVDAAIEKAYKGKRKIQWMEIYAGIEWQADSKEAKKMIKFLQNDMGVKKIRFPEHCGIGIKPISKSGTYRLVKRAIQYAIDNNKDSVTLVHKGNIMKFTEGGF